MDDEVKGILVGDVTKGSPADRAGLKHGDIVLEFAGREVADVGTFRNRVAATKPDTAVAMVVWRGGERRALNVTIGELPSKEELASAAADESKPLGLTVEALTDELARKYGYTNESGVVVTHVEPGSTAMLAGIRPGWLIMEVNRKPTNDTTTFHSEVEKGLDGESLLLHVKSGDYSRYVTLKIG